MTLVLAWILLPLVLSVLSLGCGLLLETVSGMRIPGALLLPGGFIVISIATQFAHMTDATAQLQTPLVIALALAGYGVSRPWKRFQIDRWLAGAAVGVYAVFAAPVVLSGQATFLGYIKLDDTALYQSMLDRAAAHAYDLNGVLPGTYDSVLFESYRSGYPLGSFLPLDIGQTLLRVDTLWLWQPYLTFLAVLMALGLYQLASGLVQSRALRACVAFFGAQAALMYGYALWGGVKELFCPGVILFAACLVPRVRSAGARQVIPLAAASAAVLGGLSVGGAIWILPMLLVGFALLVLNRPLDALLQTIGVFILGVGLLSLPILSVSSHRLGHLGKFEAGPKGEHGNLVHPLKWIQMFGIWFSGDFRNPTTVASIAYVLIALIALAAVFAVVTAWRSGRWEIVVALATAVLAVLVYVERGSWWVAGKALASSSPLVLGVALVGVAVVIESRRRVEGGVAIAVLAAIAAGVLWSNVTQYHAVYLAPNSRLSELETIGAKFTGQGPALLTEYEPYAARHFLRGLAAETPSELASPQHYAYLRSGAAAGQGTSPDTDEIQLGRLLYYRTLIIRRTGIASRPPSAYSLQWSGRYYDVWQRNPGPSHIIEHMSLGSEFQPAAVPKCKAVMAIAHVAAVAHGTLVTVERPPVTVIQQGDRIGTPTSPQLYAYGELPDNVRTALPYTLRLAFHAPSAGEYTLWVGGSFNSTVTAKLDGTPVGQATNELEWPGNLLYFGSKHLTRGTHELVIHHSGPDWAPGSAAQIPFGLGPFVIAPGTDTQGTDKAYNLKLTYVPPTDARSLCGKSLDWIEALGGS